MLFKIVTAKLDAKLVETSGLCLDLWRIYQLQVQLHREKNQAKRTKNKYLSQIPLRLSFGAQKNTSVSHPFLLLIIFSIYRSQFCLSETEDSSKVKRWGSTTECYYIVFFPYSWIQTVSAVQCLQCMFDFTRKKKF